MGTLHDSLACSIFPAPSAFPTLTLAAADSPIGNYEGEIEERKCIKVSVMAVSLTKVTIDLLLINEKHLKELPCKLQLLAHML